MGIFEFNIQGHATRREWAVYIIIAQHIETNHRLFYVGKVGDNREGCNPIISRIGNHFSHNSTHAQLRNKITDPIHYNYRVLYSTFGQYNSQNHHIGKNKINELERELNRCVGHNLESEENVSFLNRFKGTGVSKTKEKERQLLLTGEEREILKGMADKAIKSM